MTLGKAILLNNWKLFEMEYFKQTKQDFAPTKNLHSSSKIDAVLLDFKTNSTYNLDLNFLCFMIQWELGNKAKCIPHKKV